MARSRLTRFAIWTAAVVTGLFISAAGALFFAQRSFMYFPDPGYAPPDTSPFPVQELLLQTNDGETLRAWYLPPQPGKPVILHFSGNGASLQIEEGRWRRIGQAGVGFLAVAYRGYSGSTGHPSEEGLHQDARAAYVWLRQKHPAQDIVIYGHSLGSGVATRLASEVPERALILESPFTAAVDRAHELYPWAPVRLLMLDQFKSREVIGKVHAPILIIHGDQDSVIPFAHGQRLFALAPSPKVFVQMIGSDHNTLTRDGAYDAVWKFLGIAADGTAAPKHETRYRQSAVGTVQFPHRMDGVEAAKIAVKAAGERLANVHPGCLRLIVRVNPDDTFGVGLRGNGEPGCPGAAGISPLVMNVLVDGKTGAATIN